MHRLPRLFWATTILAVLSCGAQALGQEFRGFWGDAFSPGFKSSSEISSLVSRAVTAHYNAVVVEVMAFQDTTGSGHGAYWNSAIVPKATDIVGGIDPLSVLITQAHAAGLEVHAWIVPLRVCSAWPPSSNPTMAAHPEWLMVPLANMGGGPAQVGGYYTLDPGSPGAQGYIASIVQELVTNYQIDGINLDYIRYVQTDAGYPADSTYTGSSLKRWQAITGNSGVPAATGNTSWNDFRRRSIDEIVRRLRCEIASISNPRQPLRFSADLICFGNAPASFTSADAYNLFQNWQSWMQKGYLDAGMPMNYKREHVSNEATWYRNWVNAAISWRYNRHMYCGQAPYLNTKANSVTQLLYCESHGANGVMTYSYDATADENVNGTPETDWTWYTSTVPTSLWTSNAALPTMSWRNSATATEGTVWGRVINGTTGLPIDNALVTVTGQPAVNADGNGNYVVTLVPASGAGTTYNVVATGGSCNMVSTTATVPPGGIVRRDFTLCPAMPVPGDMNNDGDITSTDLPTLYFCLHGPDVDYPGGNTCLRGDFDGDFDLDLADMAEFQVAY